MLSILSITIKDEEKKLSTKFLVYDLLTTDENDPIIREYIKQTLANFDGEPSDVTVNIKMEIK